MMAKKNYIVLAGALAASRPPRGAYAPPDWDQRFRQWRADVAVLIDVLRADNVARLRAKLVPQGANIPCTGEAEQALHERGVLVVPDFIANAGGVIFASIEYRGGTRSAAFAYIDERIRANTRAVLEESRRGKTLPRAAAMALAERLVRAAMQTRRWR